MKVIFTPNADANLNDIRRWISRDNRARAISFARELVDKAESLAEGALLYPEVNPRTNPGVRRLNYRDYRILYVIDGDVVRVLYIHHGRRGYP